MYKLFLCLRYLQRRYLALIAVAAVALCVAMVLIVVSVYDGFLSKVERAAKGLFGDIIVEASSLSAIGRYDEFIAELTGECRVDADFRLTEVKPAGDDSALVFLAAGRPHHAEALAGKLDFEKAVTHPARGLLYKGGRLLGEVHGQLVISPARRNPETDELKYGLRLSGKLSKPAAELTDPADPVHLQAVYARLGEGLDQVESATPVIFAYSLLRVGEDFTKDVQVYGVRLPERAAVTDFEAGLFVQPGWADASFNPPPEEVIKQASGHLKEVRKIRAREEAKPAKDQDRDLLDRLESAEANLNAMVARLRSLRELHPWQRRLTVLRGQLRAEQAGPTGQSDAGRIQALKEQIAILDEFVKNALEDNSSSGIPIRKMRMELLKELRLAADQRDQGKIDRLKDDIQGARGRLYGLYHGRDRRMILGLGIPGLSFRTPKAESVRRVCPGWEVALVVAPIGQEGLSTTITPNVRSFIVADDAKTDVYSIDSATVYVPFAALQELTDMTERRDIDDPRKVTPARCSQIHVKVKDAFASGRKLIDARKAVQAAWRKFHRVHPEAVDARWPIIIHTWRERLSKFIGPVQKQRTLVTIMFGIISFVSVLLIFAIFYMIVMQKIRDIGVVRAVGGSAPGIAQMFLAYGAATGVAGSILGLTGGYFFVRYINEIEDWLAWWSGFRVWERDVFLFDKIPNEVDPGVALVIAVWAIASGLVGALIPAVRASVMEPAEAIKYE